MFSAAKEPFLNLTGLKVFASEFFSFQKTIPQDIYVEGKEIKEIYSKYQKEKCTICNIVHESSYETQEELQ